MKSVYHIERGLNKLSDGRVNPTYSTGQVILPVFFGFLLRIKSFNELDFMIKNNEFSNLFSRGTKLPQVDSIRSTLKVIDINRLKQINHHIIKRAVENKVFEKGTIDGYTVVAIDGTKFFGSNKKSCPECSKNTKGQKTHNFHSGAVMSTVGKGVEAVLCLLFIASNSMQLFLVRRLRNHFTTQREMVSLLLKGLYLLKYKAKLVFSSS